MYKSLHGPEPSSKLAVIILTLPRVVVFLDSRINTPAKSKLDELLEGLWPQGLRPEVTDLIGRRDLYDFDRFVGTLCIASEVPVFDIDVLCSGSHFPDSADLCASTVVFHGLAIDFGEVIFGQDALRFHFP
mgnify:CR=1 FL=1